MTRPASPYAGKPEEKWGKITKRLLAAHPLTEAVIREVALAAWDKVWDTTVGSGATAVRLGELRVPATIVGYFFEVLCSREMQARWPGEWRGNRSGDEKDLVCLKNPRLSVEIKTSGQLGRRVYGNRSYGQDAQNEALVKKEKSGYYITVNFYRQALTLLRFGWIDASDWKPQSSPTGQMAGLPDKVYRHKLVVIPGDYQLNGPVELLRGVGPKAARALQEINVHTIRDLLDFAGPLPNARLQRVRPAAMQEYRPDATSSPKE
jgi:hypothetical protein